ncbi:O-antigen ligase family protein [Nakamurella sp.]|uniref:O-antigen ligase family protein n=1 Tax=Nakamurella sp. TaxID=1869182 RepID=UPI003784742B
MAKPTGRTLDSLLAAALSVFAVGNLALPEASQTILGVDYLVLVAVSFSAIIVLRFTQLLDQNYVWVAGFVLLLSIVPGLLMLAPTAYGSEKAQSLLLTAIAIFASACFHDKIAGVRRTLVWTSAASLLFALFLLIDRTVTASGRVSVFSLNPVGAARMTGIFVVTGLAMIMSSHIRASLRLAILAGAVLCSIATLMTGSRGPALSALLALIAVVTLTMRSRDVRLRTLIVGVGAMGAAMVVILDSNMAGISRVLDGGDSGRSGIYSFTIAQAWANPTGVGWGGFAGVAWRWGSRADRIYPHNLMLEVFVEGGFIALFGFAAILLYALWHGSRSYLRTKNRVECIAIGLYIYALVNSQFSSDLVGNRLLWVTLGLVLVLSHPMRNAQPKTAPGQQPVHIGRPHDGATRET